jgi:general secretion pathway protein J
MSELPERAGSGLSCRSEGGFTLIEVVLSLALTAMLLSLLSTGMYAVMNDWENDTAVLDEQLDETVAILQLERALQGAFPHSYRDESTLGRLVYFEGEDESLSWVSTVSPQRSGGMTAWRLESRNDEGVTLRLAPAKSDDPTARLDAAEPVALLPGYTARMRYLYEELDFSKQWRNDWPGAQRFALPLAVHVLLTPLDAANSERRINLIARIRAHEHRDLRPAFQPASTSIVPPSSLLPGGQ